jgi:hypothetical protein
MEPYRAACRIVPVRGASIEESRCESFNKALLFLNCWSKNEKRGAHSIRNVPTRALPALQSGGISMASNPFAAIPVHVANVQQGSEAISPKVIGSTLGGALATILWTLLAGYLPDLKHNLGDAGITAITGATGTLFAALLGYFVADPVRTATNPPAGPAG